MLCINKRLYWAYRPHRTYGSHRRDWSHWTDWSYWSYWTYWPQRRNRNRCHTVCG